MTGAIVPRVTVVVPAFNAAHCIERALTSVQAQTISDFEVVVVDDASTDECREVVARMGSADSRIRLLALERNGGPSVARNAGIDAARGTWIALLDADDAYLPARLEQLITQAEAEGVDAIGDDVMLYDGVAAREVGRGGFVRAGGQRAVSLDDYLATTTYRVGIAEAIFREDRPIALIKLVMRAAILRQHAIRYSSQYRYCEDFLFYYDLLAKGAKLTLVDRAMYVYTEPLGSISRQASPHSRTLADRQSVIDAVDAVLAGGSALTARQRRLLNARRKATVASMRYAAVRQRLSKNGKAALYFGMVSRPGLWLRFVRELRHGLTSRIRYNHLHRESRRPASAQKEMA